MDANTYWVIPDAGTLFVLYEFRNCGAGANNLIGWLRRPPTPTVRRFSFVFQNLIF